MGFTMKQFRINIAAPNLVCICVDKISGGEYSGRIYHKFGKEPLLFKESGKLITLLDRFFDELNYPQSSTTYRSFVKRPIKNKRDRELVLFHSSEKILENKGERFTFILHVQYRQNSTWQGKLIWVEQEQEAAFDSMLELIKLMDSIITAE